MPRLIVVLIALVLLGGGAAVCFLTLEGDGPVDSRPVVRRGDESQRAKEPSRRDASGRDRTKARSETREPDSGQRPAENAVVPDRKPDEASGSRPNGTDSTPTTAKGTKPSVATTDQGQVPPTSTTVAGPPALTETTPTYREPEGGGLREPILQAFGDGTSYTSRQRSSVTRRPTGFLPNQPPINDKPKRRVRGRVVERVGSELRGLPDVVVTDWREIHRAFTDKDGNFDFEARFADDSMDNMPGVDRDHNDMNDFVHLTAYADGYVMSGKGVQVNGVPGQRYYTGMTFGPSEVNSEAGVLLEMKWQGAEVVVVKLTNPPSDADKISITVESYSEGQSNADNGFFLSAFADKSGTAKFHLPNRRQLEIRAIGEKWRSSAPANYDNAQKAWMLTLVPSNNTEVKGVVIDQRSNLPLPNVRVRANSEKEVAYSKADGTFSLWVQYQAGDSGRFVHLICEHPSYVRANALLKEDLTVPFALQAGGTFPDGPWRATMRPAVGFKANVQTSDGSTIYRVLSVEIAIQDNLNRVVHGTVENGSAVLNIGDFPWGAQRLTLVVSDEGNQRHTMYDVELSPSMWNDQNDYDLRLFASKKQ